MSVADTDTLSTTLLAQLPPLLCMPRQFSLDCIALPLYFRLLKSSASATGGDASRGQARLEAIEEEETVRMHLAALKREEVALQVKFGYFVLSCC